MKEEVQELTSGELLHDNCKFLITQFLINPFIIRWYHGRLDRYTAEERLWELGELGSYLVRESDRKPGSYVLSYLGKAGINHFRYITNIFTLLQHYCITAFVFGQ